MNQTVCSRFAALLLSACLSLAGIAQAKDINIIDAGAIPGTGKINTLPIQRAIDECAAGGGGRVIVPAGEFFTGTLYLKSRVNLSLEEGAVLKGSDQITDYHAANNTPALIIGENIQQVAITGNGTLDGNGGARNFQKGDNGEGRPMLLFFIGCTDVKVENITLRNSAFWTEKYSGCDGVLVSGIRVWAHANWNNDGIDIDSKNVVVSDCRFDTDDDAVCLKSERKQPCENVVISNCIIASNCNGIKMGTASSGGFQNISISNCVIHHAGENNIRRWKATMPGITEDTTVISGIAIECVDGGHTNQINISDITMKDVQTPIFIRLGERHRPAGELQQVNIHDVIATSESRMCSIIAGIPGAAVKEVTIENVQLISHSAGDFEQPLDSVPENTRAYPENRMFGAVLPASGFYIRHASGVRLYNIRLQTADGEKRPFLAADDVQGLVVKDAGITDREASYPFIYRLRNVKQGLIAPPAFLPRFDALVKAEGANTTDIIVQLPPGSFNKKQLVASGPEVKKGAVRFYAAPLR